MAKGIRVNQLAKELGVPSKAILDKLRDEGMAEHAPNHMSVLSLGLAESVREWFHSSQGGVATAVETAPPVEPTKPKTVRRKKKADEASDLPAAEVPVVAPVTEPEPPQPTIEPAAPVIVPEVVAPVPVIPSVEIPLPPPPPAPVSLPPAPPVMEIPTPEPVAKAEPPAVPVPTAVTPPPAETAPPPTRHSRTSAKSTAGGAAATARPTVTLQGRPLHTPVRKPVTPAPKLETLEPAKIQGPRVVRVEKEETVNIRAPRGPRMPREGSEGPIVTPQAPRGGRGVKTTDEEGEESDGKKKAGKGGRTLSSRRRGPDGRRGEAMEKLKEYTEADLIERRDRLAAATSYRTGFDNMLKKKSEKGQHVTAKSIVQRGEPVELEEPITVRSLAVALGVKTSDIIGKLMRQGVFATVNQALEHNAAEAIALEYGLELKIRQQETLEEQLQNEFASRERKEENLVPRPPVVTILGHVDHGKTSLLDKIRHANVAAGEAGGITQHTAAWMVQLGDKRVTFIDTPGHQAFTAMRARGANMTDVVVLVVSAAEGVQPQTIESLNHARAAGVPIVVAMNKVDRPDANVQAVLGQLAGNGINPVEWGGDTEVVKTSATTGQGIPELIEILDYQAELLELKADPSASACGIVIESRMDEGLGAVATVLVQDGTLRVGDIVLCGPGYGRMRSFVNDRGEMIQEAGPAMPVIISGLNALPNAGDRFYAVEDLEQARSIAEERQNRVRQEQLASKAPVSLDSMLATIKAAEAKEIRLIIKGDVQGSVETLSGTVTGANTDEVKIRVIHAAVGPISESDVELADASGAVIVGFHVVPDEAARQMAEQRRVEIRLYRVIYELLDDLKKALSGLLEPEIREKLHGHAEVRQVFKVSRVGNICGCMVTDGHIQRGSKIRLIRNGVVITEELAFESLRRVKDDVREVKAGFECGIKLAGYDDVKVGDRLEAYARETIQRTL